MPANSPGKLLVSLFREVEEMKGIRFSFVHVWRALMLISREKPLGRKRLSLLLGVGEGSTRTILKILRKHNLIRVTRGGIFLTRTGEQLVKQMPIKVEKVEPSRLTVASKNVAVLVKGVAHKVRYGIEQRDHAVRAGAKGATTIVVKAGKLVVPGITNDLEKDDPKLARELVLTFKPEDGDVIIVSGADDYVKAEEGGFMAAYELVKVEK